MSLPVDRAAIEPLGAHSLGLRADSSAARRRLVWSPGLTLLLVSLPAPIVLVVGLFLGSDTVVLAGAGLAVASALVRPDVGLMSLVLVAPMLTVQVLPAPGFQFFLVASIVLGSVYRLPLDRPQLTLSPIFLLAAAYVFYVFVQQLPEMIAGYPGGEDFREVGSLMAKLLTGFGTILAAAVVLRGKSPYPYLAALLMAASVVAILGIVAFIEPDAIVIPGAVGDIIEPGVRASGFFTNPNYFGQFIAGAIILALGWTLAWGRGGVRWLLLGSLGLLGVALMASQSRGALIALVVGVIALAFSRSRKTGLVALLLGGALAVVAIPLLIELRLAQDAGLDVISAVERQGASDGYRLHALEAGAQAFLTSPLFGVGLFRYTLETGFYPHNWFMRIISEQGLVGLTLAIGILVLAYRRFRSLSTLPRSIAMGLLAYAVAGGFFHEPLANIQSLVALLFMFTIVVAADWSKGADGRPAPITAPRGSI